MKVVRPISPGEQGPGAGTPDQPSPARAQVNPDVPPTTAIGVWPGGWSSNCPARGDQLAYQREVWERTILFWDMLRQRADNIIAQEQAGKPPLLDRQVVADGSSFMVEGIEAFDAVREFLALTRELWDRGYKFWFEAPYGRAVTAEPDTISPPIPRISEPAQGRTA